MGTTGRSGMLKACCLVLWVFARHTIAEHAEGSTYSHSSAQQHSSSSSVSWFVQLSDLHINRWTHQEIVPDLAAFGQQVLASTRPAAVLITGDLVDAKTRPEGSQQHKEEWQAYEQAWQQLARSAQLPPSAILDLRGNHDIFDTMRNSRQDFFSVHSAAAAAHGQDAAAEQRVWVREVQPQLLLQPVTRQTQQQHKRKHRHGATGDRRRLLLHGSTDDSTNSVTSSSSSSDGGVGRDSQGALSRGQHAAKRTAALSKAPIQSAAARELHAPATAAAAATAPCPAAVLLGLDFTPNLGLHSPANFFGVAGPGLLRELQQQLQQLRSSSSSSSANPSPLLPQHCSHRVPVISYSHYPFSTVASMYGGSSRDGSGTAVQGGRAVRDLLQRYDVSAHLSGHLHDLLGPRMQAMYRKQGSTTYLADWEAADWKQRRRWRLLAVDSAATSFADLHFRRSYCSIAAAAAGTCHAGGSSSSSGGSSGSNDGYWYEVSAVDSSRVVSQHVVMLTWPPDGRYSPLTAAQFGSSSGVGGIPSEDLEQQQSEGKTEQGSTSQYDDVLPVRVLVVPLQLRGSSSAKHLAGVRLEWYCQGSASDLAAGLSSKGKTLGSTTMHPVGTPAAAEDSSAEGAHEDSTSNQDNQSSFPYELTQPQVFAAAVPLLRPHHLTHQCGSRQGVLLLQVTVEDSSGGASTSELRPVLVSQGASSSSKVDSQQRSAAIAAAVEGHLPLPSSIAEETLLTFDGQRFAVQLFMAGWLAQVVGLLLLPRLLGRSILAASAHLNSSYSADRLLRHQQSMQQYQLQEHFKRSFSLQCRPIGPLDIVKALFILLFRVLKTLAVQFAKLLLLPFMSMAVLAQQHAGIWWAVLGHCMWVLVGPWFCAQMSSSSKGLGLWFRYGMLLPLPADLAASWVSGDVGSPFHGGEVGPDGVTDEESTIDVDSIWQEYKWVSIPDTHLISSLTACLILAPLTLWLGLVVSHWHAVAAAARRSGPGCSSAPVAAAAAVCNAGAAAGAAFLIADSRSELTCTETVFPVEIEFQQQQHQQGSAGGSSSKAKEPTTAAAVGGGGGGTIDATVAVTGTVRLGRTRSHPTARRRESTELAETVLAAAAAVGVAGRHTQGISRSGSCEPGGMRTGVQGSVECSSSCSSSDMVAAGAAQEEEQLLLLQAAAAAPAAAVGTAAWFTKLLPATTTTSSSSSEKDMFSQCLFSPRYLACCALYVLLLAIRPAWRAVQLCLVSLRIPLPLLLLAAPVWVFWYKVCWRLAAAYGPVALLVNPVIGWLPLLMVLALRSVRHQLTAGKALRRE